MILKKASRNLVVYKSVPCDKNATCGLSLIFVFYSPLSKTLWEAEEWMQENLTGWHVSTGSDIC